MNPKVTELYDDLRTQMAELEKVSTLISLAEIGVLDRKQQLAQANEALQALEGSIAQDVLADTTLTNESKRAAALRAAQAKDPDWVALSGQAREQSHALAVDQQHVKQLAERRANLEIHSRNLQRAAELLAAQLHEQAQAKRQVASQQFLQGVTK